MTVFVLSTMTNPINYTFYDYIGDPGSKGGRIPVAKKKIYIAGGANLPSSRSGFGDMQNGPDGTPVWTAEGMVTPVSDSNFEILKDHWLFRKHLESDPPRVRVLNKDITGNHAAVKKEVSSMLKRDNHSQLRPGQTDRRINVKTPLQIEQESQFRI